MSSFGRFTMLVMVTLVVGLSAAHTTGAKHASLDAGSQRLLEEVKLVYGSSRDAITSLSVRYQLHIDDMTWEALWVYDKPKWYRASVAIVGEGRALPHEAAWSGSRAYQRHSFRRMNLSGDPHRARAAVPEPLDEVGRYVDYAVGLLTSNEQRYVFQSGRLLEGSNRIELTFEAPWINGTLVTIHDRRLNCWPVDVTLTRADGTLLYDVDSIEYAVQEAQGNRLVYPINYSAVGLTPAGTETRMAVVAEPASLEINQSVDPARFELTPWPSETVYDWDEKKRTKPSDPDWIEAGKVDFPFDEFAEIYYANVAQGRSGATPQQQQAARAALAQIEDAESGTSWLVIGTVAGLSAVAVAAFAWLLGRSSARRSSAAIAGRRGFSLPELLVVIGIIALLLAILLPALAGARRQSRYLNCVSQLREIGAAMADYANRHQGFFYPMERSHRTIENPGSRLHLVLDDAPWQMLVCPTADETAEDLSYVINGQTGWGRARQNYSGRGVSPSDIILLGENTPGSNFELGFPQFPVHVSLIDRERHNDTVGSAYLWLDLHVSQRLLTPEQLLHHLDVP